VPKRKSRKFSIKKIKVKITKGRTRLVALAGLVIQLNLGA